MAAIGAVFAIPAMGETFWSQEVVMTAGASPGGGQSAGECWVGLLPVQVGIEIVPIPNGQSAADGSGQDAQSGQTLLVE
jgi:hypothetical protein